MRRTETRACSRCLLVYPRSCFNESFCNFPIGYTKSRRFFSPSRLCTRYRLFRFFFPGILFFNQSHPWICMYETSNINSTSDTYLVCVIRVYIYKNILHVYIMIKLLIQHYSSVAAYSGYTKCIKTELQYVYCCRMHVRVCTYRYILYHSYFATTNSSSSGSATAASCVCCCLPYAILGIRKNR